MRVLVSVGEASGDRLAAHVLEALGRRRPGLEVRGMLGPALRAAGHEALAEPAGVMGLIEVLGALGALREARARLREALRQRPDLFLAVDAPDFNLPLCREARALGVPVVLLGSPQVWAWRAGRARDIAAVADRVLCLLPFEPPIYEALGGAARFIGHPLYEARAPLGPPGEDWAILPGSRPAELTRLLPDLAAAARLLRARHPGSRARLPVAPGLQPAQLAALADLDGVELVDTLEEAVGPARACLVASGSATLELAALGRPMAVCYRLHPLTWWVARALVRGVRHIALPNLILGRGVAPELIQRFTPEDLADAAERAAVDAAWPGAFAELRGLMGPPGAAERAAEAIMGLLSARPAARALLPGPPP